MNLKELLNKNKEWQKIHAKKNYWKLKEKQNPEFAIISCSDSRVPVESIFNVEPNKLFVLRNIANQAFTENESNKAFLEYALNHLNIKKIIVLGHTNCGGIKGLKKIKEIEKSISKWLKKTLKAKKILDKKIKELNLTTEEYENALIELNVLWQIKNLYDLKQINSKKVFLYGWIYELETGKIYTDFKMLKKIALLKKILKELKLELKEKGYLKKI